MESEIWELGSHLFLQQGECRRRIVNSSINITYLVLMGQVEAHEMCRYLIIIGGFLHLSFSGVGMH